MPYKFIRTPDEHNDFDNEIIEMSTTHSEYTYDELCGIFENFLRASGFHFDGHVEVVPPEDLNQEEDD